MALAAAGALTACGSNTVRSTEPERASFERSSEAPDPTAKFVHDAYGIGASWYSYESSTHTLRPHPEWFRLEFADETYALHIDSYYDDRGESGFFTLKSREKRADGWSSVRTFEATSSVKKGEVCVDLERLAETSCEESARHLMLRTDLRAVPGAGFAVSNPALYVRGHYSTADGDPVRIRSIEGSNPSGEQLRGAGVDLPSSRLNLSESAVGPLRDGSGERRVRGWFYQATGDMQLVRWRIAEVEASGDEANIAVEAGCSELARNRSEQSLAPDEELEQGTISVPTGSDYSVGLVELCDEGPRRVETRSDAYGGRWPSTDTFDLFVEHWRGRVAVRLPPGHLVWNAGGRLAAHGSVDSAESLPGNLWGS